MPVPQGQGTGDDWAASSMIQNGFGLFMSHCAPPPLEPLLLAPLEPLLPLAPLDELLLDDDELDEVLVPLEPLLLVLDPPLLVVALCVLAGGGTFTLSCVSV